MTARVDAILTAAGEPEWDIATADTVRFATFTARPVVAVAALR